MRQFQPVIQLHTNTSGRDFYAPDIHGCFKPLEDLLDRVQFDTSKDRLILGGDLVDRGPESLKALDYMRAPWAHIVRGNHEDFCLMSGEDGVCAFHATYGGIWYGSITREQRVELMDEIRKLPYLIDLQMPTGQRYGFVHAELPVNDWAECVRLLGLKKIHEGSTLEASLLMGRSKIYQDDRTLISGIDCIFVGHTVVDEPIRIGNVIYMDTGCGFSTGHLTLRCLNTQQDVVSKPMTHYYSTMLPRA